MKLTDPYVLRQLKIANCEDLNRRIDNYPEDMRLERSDLDILHGAVMVIVSEYYTDSTVKDYLEMCSYAVRKPDRYPPEFVQERKKTVNEYKRLKNLEIRLVDKLNNN